MTNNEETHTRSRPPTTAEPEDLASGTSEGPISSRIEYDARTPEWRETAGNLATPRMDAREEGFPAWSLQTECNRLREILRQREEQTEALHSALSSCQQELNVLQRLKDEVWANPERWMKWCDHKVLERAEAAERSRDALQQERDSLKAALTGIGITPYLDRMREIADKRDAAVSSRDALHAALEGVLIAWRLPIDCVHDSEPDICDGCHYAMEKAMAAATARARLALGASR